MGYRNYIGVMPKRDYNKVKSFTRAQLEEYFKTDYPAPYEITKELYGFGKYCDFDFPKGSWTKFYKNKDTREDYEDYDMRIVKPEFLEAIIENYRKRIQKYYTDMLEGYEPRNKETWTEEHFAKLHEHVSSFSSEWNYLTPFDLKKGDEITTSWKFEYGIFELVRIYKTFDWKKNVMVWYGF